MTKGKIIQSFFCWFKNIPQTLVLHNLSPGLTVLSCSGGEDLLNVMSTSPPPLSVTVTVTFALSKQELK